MSTTRRDPIRLYEGVAPGSEDWTHHESAYYSEIFGNQVVTNVVVPTVTPVLPDEPSGTAVVVAPGGGFHALSIESEGFEVAEWLAARGVSAFVVKYRLVPCGDDAVAEMIEKLMSGIDGLADDMDRIAPLGGADGRAAVALVRRSADEFGVRTDRIGIVGFSAGGNVAVRVAYASDPVERPDFVAPIYASTRGIDLAPPAEGSGPIFVVAATDDSLGLADDSVALYDCWRRAGAAAELHMYATGGHGFGMKRQGMPSDSWIERFGDWLAGSRLLRP